MKKNGTTKNAPLCSVEFEQQKVWKMTVKFTLQFTLCLIWYFFVTYKSDNVIKKKHCILTNGITLVQLRYNRNMLYRGK